MWVLSEPAGPSAELSGESPLLLNVIINITGAFLSKSRPVLRQHRASYVSLEHRNVACWACLTGWASLPA